LDDFENNPTSIKENNFTILICVYMHFMRNNKLMTENRKANKYYLLIAMKLM